MYTYFRVPEPTGKSFAEIDILFERGVSARKFGSTKVDPFEVELREKAEAAHVEDVLGHSQGFSEKGVSPPTATAVANSTVPL